MKKKTARHLTEDEITFLKEYFDDTIDYSKVKVYNKQYMPIIHPEDGAIAPNGNIYMRGVTYRDDYMSDDTPLHTRSTFLHEMVHVWQKENKVLNLLYEACKENLKHKFNYNAAYHYVLEEGKDLVNYGMEQQASIIQDYFVMKNTEGYMPHRLKNENVTKDEAMALYESVLQNFLENPAYAQKCKKSITGKRYMKMRRNG